MHFNSNFYLQDEEIEEEVGDYKNLELEISDKSFDLESTKSLKRKSSELSRSDSLESGTKVKKITLNRHLTDELDEPKVDTQDETNNERDDEKKVIKFSELSAKEVFMLFMQVLTNRLRSTCRNSTNN